MKLALDYINNWISKIEGFCDSGRPAILLEELKQVSRLISANLSSQETEEEREVKRLYLKLLECSYGGNTFCVDGEQYKELTIHKELVNGVRRFEYWDSCFSSRTATLTFEIIEKDKVRYTYFLPASPFDFGGKDLKKELVISI